MNHYPLYLTVGKFISSCVTLLIPIPALHFKYPTESNILFTFLSVTKEFMTHFTGTKGQN